MNLALINEIAKESGVELDNKHITFVRRLILKCHNLALEEWSMQDDANDYPASDAIFTTFFSVDT